MVSLASSGLSLSLSTGKGVALGQASGLVRAGLMALWMPALDYFPGITAPTVTDRSGHGNTLTLGSTGGVDANDPAWGQQGLTGNGTAQYCVAASYLTTAAFTYSVIFRPTNVLAAEQWPISQYSGGTGRYMTRLQTSGAIGPFFGGASVTSAAGVISNNNWYQVTVTRDASGNALLYVNNIIRASGTLGSANSVPDPAVMGLFANVSAGAPGSNALRGTIAAAWAYARQITAADEARNYRWLRTQLAPAGIVLP